MKRIFLVIGIALAGVFAVWHSFNPLTEKVVPKGNSIPVLASSTLIMPTKPLVDFSLIDTTGKPFTKASLLGHWTLMFFGYAQCPDTCPKTLVTLSEVWNTLPQAEENTPLHFLFVSLDPESDTPQNLQAFLNRFHTNFAGLTGEKSVIERLSKHCSIYHWQDPKAKTGRKIDHSSPLLLIDPQGHIKALFSPPYQKEPLVKDLETLLKG